jgi:hypothetical protein
MPIGGCDGVSEREDGFNPSSFTRE